MKEKEINFLEYLGHEETNLLTSIIQNYPEFGLFSELDNIYQAPIKRIEIIEREKTVPQLYIFVHFYKCESLFLAISGFRPGVRLTGSLRIKFYLSPK